MAGALAGLAAYLISRWVYRPVPSYRSALIAGAISLLALLIGLFGASQISRIGIFVATFMGSIAVLEVVLRAWAAKHGAAA